MTHRVLEVILAIGMAGCEGRSESAGATPQPGGGGGSGGEAGAGGGGTGGWAGAAGAVGLDACGVGLGGWGPSGEHGRVGIAVGYHAAGPDLTNTSVFIIASKEQNGGVHDILHVDKTTGDTKAIGELPARTTDYAVTDARLFLAGHEQAIEGPPPDGWLRSLDVATSAVDTLATFTEAAPAGLVVSGDWLWFSAGGVLRRIPTSGGSVENVFALPEGRPFAAGSNRVYLLVASGISAYDVQARGIVPIADWSEAWSEHKLRGGWFYFRTMTESPALFRVPEAGGTPKFLLEPSGIYFDVGTFVFRDAGACPNGRIERVALTGTSSQSWVAGLCYSGKLALDATHLYFLASQPDGAADLLRVNVQ